MTDVVVVGAGPVGLTLATRLAGAGVPVTVLDSGDGLRGAGSKALCMQRESLEAWDRLGGLGERIAARGVPWTVDRVFFRGRELFSTAVAWDSDDRYPPLVNVSQAEVEGWLLERAGELGVRVRWGAPVTGLRQDVRGVTLAVEGHGDVRAQHVVGCDGGRSTVRRLLGLGFPGRSYADLFLVADVRVDLPLPAERRVFFDPPFNRGRQVVVQPQPDGRWRIDWQVPPETDIDQERRSGRLDARIQSVVGDADYELEWLTSYRFHSRLVERMAVGRVFLAGDAAHLTGPFGARGLNAGIGDVENLAWKLWLVARGLADPELLASYHRERYPAARAGQASNGATMGFLIPPFGRRWVRNAVLRGASHSSTLRRRVRPDRPVGPPTRYGSPDAADGCGTLAPDGPCEGDGLSRLRAAFGQGFVGLYFPTASAADAVVAAATAQVGTVPTRIVAVLPTVGPAAAVAGAGATVLRDVSGMLLAAYAPEGLSGCGLLVVVRPDGYIATRRLLRVPADAAALPPLVAAACGGRATPADAVA